MSVSATNDFPISPNGRVGPFEVVRELLRAPGAWLAEARDSSGQVRLLQLARFRGVSSEEDRADRQRQEKAIAQRTLELLSDSDVTVHAHGGTDVDNGERVLFWALPWTEGAFLVDRIAGEPLTVGELLRIGIMLAERMAARHAWGRVDPLLSEHLLRLQVGGPPEVVGIPVVVDSSWLSPSMSPSRCAPEERTTGAATPSGDIWRLGKLLEAVARHTQDLPSEVRRAIAEIAENEPARRVSSALDVVSRLNSLAAARFERAVSSAAQAATSMTFSTLPDAKAQTTEPPQGSSTDDALERSTAVCRGEATITEAAAANALAVAMDALQAEGEGKKLVSEVVVAGTNLQTMVVPELRAEGATPLVVAEAPDLSTAAESRVEWTHAGGGAGDLLDDATLEAGLRARPRHDTEISPFSPPDTLESSAPIFEKTAASSEEGPDHANAEKTEGTTPGDWASAVARRTGALLSEADDSLPMIASELVEPVELVPSEAITHRAEPDAPVAAGGPSPLETSEPSILPGLARADTEREAHAALSPKVTGAVRSMEPKTNGHHSVSLEAIAAGWQQPVLPAGESPWSEIVHPRGTHHRDRTAFPGFPDDVPVPSPRVEKRAQAVVAPPDPAPVHAPPESFEMPGADPADAELAEAMRGLDKRKVISAVLVGLVILGFFALISRVGDGERGEAREPVVITASNEVALDSEPPGATVVAERDGSILGKTPLQILVAPGSNAAVFFVAPEHEPLRLSLPTRGGLVARLKPLDSTECTVQLKVPAGIEIEGVDVDLGSKGEQYIPGAAIVRAKPGQELRGARLVLCPVLGGDAERDLKLERTPHEVSVHVTQPEGAAAYVNGDPIGTVPGVGRTTSAFSRLRIDDQNGETEERWASTDADVEIALSPPKSKPLPHVVAPDGERELELPERAEAATESHVDDDERLDARPGEEGKSIIQTAPAAKQKLTRAQRVIRARRLLKAGSKLLLAGQLERARESLIECIELDSSAAECHRDLGKLYRRARSTHKAREHFMRYLELAPDASDAERVRRMIAQ